MAMFPIHESSDTFGSKTHFMLMHDTVQVKKSELKETWENSPDRYLLELGGVKTQRPTEQQQQ